MLLNYRKRPKWRMFKNYQKGRLTRLIYFDIYCSFKRIVHPKILLFTQPDFPDGSRQRRIRKRQSLQQRIKNPLHLLMAKNQRKVCFD